MSQQPLLLLPIAKQRFITLQNQCRPIPIAPSTSERQRRLTQHLYLYCGASGHMILACPLPPPQSLVIAIQPSIQRMNPLSTCDLLTVSKTVISVSALLDSGSAGNFISRSLCRHPRPRPRNRLRSSIHNGQTTYSTSRQTQCGSTTTPNRLTPSRDTGLTGSGEFYGGHHTRASLAGAA